MLRLLVGASISESAKNCLHRLTTLTANINLPTTTTIVLPGLVMIPPTKKRKKSAVEEITFDSSAREEYLTGFHKRKVQRVKHAQEEAAKKERQERVIGRKKVKEVLQTVALQITNSKHGRCERSERQTWRSTSRR